MKIEKVFRTVGSYTLLKIEANYQPYVVAYKYDPQSQSWAQGHYFCKYHHARHDFHKRAIRERRTV